MKKSKFLYIYIFLLLGIFLSSWIKFKESKETFSNYKNIAYYQVYSLNKPDSVSFCGDRVPIERKEVQEKLDEAIYKISYMRRENNRIRQRMNHWFPKIEKILAKHHIPDDFKYLAVVESNLNPAAQSPKGALGIWQFIPSTAIAMGMTVNEEQDDRIDPLKSTRAACLYFKRSYKQLNNWTNVAASYNMGIAGLQRQLLTQRTDSYFDLDLNKETGQYMYKILAVKEIMKAEKTEDKQQKLMAFIKNDLINHYLGLKLI